MHALAAMLFTACVLSTPVQQSQTYPNDEISVVSKQSQGSVDSKLTEAELIRLGTNNAGRETLVRREGIILDLWTGQ